MKTTDQTLREVIKRITTAITVEDKTKLETAKQLYWGRHVLNWRLTEYGGWGKFCEQELHMMSLATIARYISVARRIESFDYSDKECHEMISGLGWSRFCNAMMLLKRRIQPKSVIEKYRNISPAGAGNKPETDPNGDRAYSFSLPCAVADKFDSYLLELGMSIPYEGKRRGVRDAMIRLVEEILD